MIPSLTTRRNALRLALAGAALPLLGSLSARAATGPSVAVWQDPTCGCCQGWVRHMRQAGFNVMVHFTSDMGAIKQARGVPDDMQSCHTAVIDGYIVEGHVPAPDIVRLLGDRPDAKGLAVPGMPASAPGMDQPGQPYDVMVFGTPAGDRIYASH